MLKKGTILEGKYEILKQIGTGGTSIVYLAMNQKLNRQWVIKEIDHKKCSSDMEKVIKEAQLMMGFDHPAIPRIVDIIEKQKFTYIIMDYVSGKSLAYELKKKGLIPQETAIEWAKQICNVLIYLHSLNPPIIYHDLKPGNIILKEPERNLKLVDFGEARPCIRGKALDAGKTKEYAAPEQQGELCGPTDERTDIYCFGTTFYRLLTGRFPPTWPQTVGSVREICPELEISKGMDNIIRKCTQQEPARRFQSAVELMNALENIRLWDDDYRKDLKRKTRMVTGMAAVGLGLLLAGIVSLKSADFIVSKKYENLVETAQSVDYETRILNYAEAVGMDGNNPKAYIKLLEAYEANGTFGNPESQQFSALYNRNKMHFSEDDEEVLDLHFLAGCLYFHMYSDEHSQVRSRVLKSQEYFKYVCDHGSKSYEHYEIASGYYTLCSFFETYVLNHNSIREPDTEDYSSMLEALEKCLADMQNYQAKDAAYTRLLFYEFILDMLNVNMRGLSCSGIDREKTEQILYMIRENTLQENVTQQVSVSKQENILKILENVSDNLQREYESTERGE